VPAPAFCEPWDESRLLLLAGALAGPGRAVTAEGHGRGRSGKDGGSGRTRGSGGGHAGGHGGDWLDGLAVDVKAAKRRVPKSLFRLSTPSPRLVEDVSRLLLRFGISTRTVIREGGQGTVGGEGTAYRLVVSGLDSQRRFLQEIGVTGQYAAAAERLLAIVREREAATPGAEAVPEDVWTSMREVMSERAADRARGARDGDVGGPGPAADRRERLGRVVAVLDSAELDLHAVNDVVWEPVVSVEADGVEQVFDATVVGGHNFVANGVAVHNSIEQDADMVILLHRDEAYEKESQRAGEADLIVAKHRNGPTDTIVVAFQGHYSRFTNMATGF
jgi:replicative DNA helicase